MTKTLANGYSSESTQRELSNEYQHDSVLIVFKDFCILVSWTKVASAPKMLRKYVLLGFFFVGSGQNMGSAGLRKGRRF